MANTKIGDYILLFKSLLLFRIIDKYEDLTHTVYDIKLVKDLSIESSTIIFNIPYIKCLTEHDLLEIGTIISEENHKDLNLLNILYYH